MPPAPPEGCSAELPARELVEAASVVLPPRPRPLVVRGLDAAAVVLGMGLLVVALRVLTPSSMAASLPGPCALLPAALSATQATWCLMACLGLVVARRRLREVRHEERTRGLVVGPPHAVSRYLQEGRLSAEAVPLDVSGESGDASPARDSARSACRLEDIVLSQVTDEVVLLAGWKDDRGYEETLRTCATLGVDLSAELVALPSAAPEGMRIERRGTSWYARLGFVPRGPAIGAKYAVEYLTALAATAVALPLMACIALAIKLDSPGSVLFRQKRTGLNGRRITCFKFRTMFDGAHATQCNLTRHNEMHGTGLLFKMDDDPRVTRVGRWLRKTSLDELPQLLNVLRGELTLIGPRLLSIPLQCYEPAHRRRLSVRPGIACVWQAWHRKETDFAAWMRSDLDYLDRWSALRDLKILLRTAFVVLRGDGAR